MLSPNQAVADGCHRCQFCGHVFPQISHTFFLPDLIPISKRGHLNRRLTPCVSLCVVCPMLSLEAPRTPGHTVDADGLARDHRVARENV